MARCRIFSIDDELQPVVADGLYTKNYRTPKMSVSVVKFVAPVGATLPAKPHAHGEEASLQILGGCSVFQGEGGDSPEYRMAAGDALIIPAQQAHFGTNRFGAEGVSLRLNVVSPPRAEFGANGGQVYYPLAEGGGRKP